MIDEVLLNEAKIAKYLLINKMVFEFSGKIKIGYFSNWDTVRLIQNSGYEINLLTRIEEIAHNYNNKISTSYWITKTPKTPEELIEYKIYASEGFLSFELESHEIRYSEYTSDINYSVDFMVGGHNLLQELKSHKNEYLYMMIEVDDKNRG